LHESICYHDWKLAINKKQASKHTTRTTICGRKFARLLIFDNDSDAEMEAAGNKNFAIAFGGSFQSDVHAGCLTSSR